MPHINDNCVNLEEIAEYLAVNKRYCWKWRKRTQYLPLNRQTMEVQKNEIDEWVKSGKRAKVI
jgi:hypothetical protein